MNKSTGVSVTSQEVSLRATRIAKASRVNSSTNSEHAEPPALTRPILGSALAEESTEAR